MKPEYRPQPGKKYKVISAEEEYEKRKEFITETRKKMKEIDDLINKRKFIKKQKIRVWG